MLDILDQDDQPQGECRLAVVCFGRPPRDAEVECDFAALKAAVSREAAFDRLCRFCQELSSSG